MIKHTLLLLTLSSVVPLMADVFDFGTYKVYQCGLAGSPEYQACQDRMARGEAQFLSTYQDVPIVLGPGDLTSLPPLQPNHRYVIAAAAGGWILYSDHDEDTDSHPVYKEHNGIFIPDDVSVDPTGLVGDVVYINLAGTVIAGSHSLGLYSDSIGWIGSFWFGDNTSQWVWRDMLTYNDAGQIMGRGYNQQFVLVDPTSASAVPEPSALVLLLIVMTCAVFIARPGKKALDV